jgi:hypothetical protein
LFDLVTELRERCQGLAKPVLAIACAEIAALYDEPQDFIRDLERRRAWWTGAGRDAGGPLPEADAGGFAGQVCHRSLAEDRARLEAELAPQEREAEALLAGIPPSRWRAWVAGHDGAVTWALTIMAAAACLAALLATRNGWIAAGAFLAVAVGLTLLVVAPPGTARRRAALKRANAIAEANAGRRAAIVRLDRGHTALRGRDGTNPLPRGRRALTWDREGIQATLWATGEPCPLRWEDLDALTLDFDDNPLADDSGLVWWAAFTEEAEAAGRCPEVTAWMLWDPVADPETTLCQLNLLLWAHQAAHPGAQPRAQGDGGGT